MAITKISGLGRLLAGLRWGLGILIFTPLVVSGQNKINYNRPLVNQTGYNLNEAKRFVLPYAPDGLAFALIKAADSLVAAPKPLYIGKINNQAGEFTAFNPNKAGEQYVIRVAGYKPSMPFWVADHLLEKLSSKLAYQFFIDVRGSEDPVHSNEANVYSGGPSRDAGAYGLEAVFETLLYASNPALFDRWTEEMGNKKTADLIDLILWHAEFAYHHVDYNGPVAKRHGTLGYKGQPRMQYDYWNTLDQLAPVLAAYHSFLKPHLSQEKYQQYRKVCLEKWTAYDRHKVVRYWTESDKWVDIGFQEFNEMGNAFGQSVFSNLFMYLSEQQEPDGKPEQFLKWAQESATDIIQNWDFNNPRHTWWIRNAEHITPQALAFFLLVAPDKAPAGTKEKLMAWRDHMQAKTANLWHYRVHSETEWAHPKTKELGGAPALGGSMFAVSHLLQDPELRKKGWSQVDFVFGANPLGTHLSNKSPERVAINGYWEGVEKGWPWAYTHGYGQLGKVRGTLDGTPLDYHFPRENKSPVVTASAEPVPQIMNGSYATEGWAISNRGWMATVTFATLGSHEIRHLDKKGKKVIETARANEEVIIELKAALNQDWQKPESAWVEVAVDEQPFVKVPVTETGPNTGVFRAVYKVGGKANLTAKYGYLGFDKKARLAIR
ncbi:hypothetical protein [Adhaeribacter rhizoryzae]|uniref:hypothetical protein n=1 Tax=Adhaeribacter rhizoryzae TaxID=2607907 RepID=UPI00167FDEF0|nr:hypothetical protein [Adhaeribacter rhizoryzae]